MQVIKDKYIKKTFELEENLLHKFKVFAVCNNKKQRDLIKEMIEFYFEVKSLAATTK